jgi:anti-sigma B factor antagonist
MSIAIVRPAPFLDATEAQGLRASFARVLDNGCTKAIVDLTGVQELSAAGLAAVTNFLTHGRRLGFPIRVLLPEAGSHAARMIDQADLSRFLLAHARADGSVDRSVVRPTPMLTICGEPARMRRRVARKTVRSPEPA